MGIDFEKLDGVRAEHGYLTLAETFVLIDSGNAVLDPFSLLIGRAVAVGRRNTFYPNVTIACDTAGAIAIGDDNAFHSGTSLFAVGGWIAIGARNQFGEGGFIARADRAGAMIEIGDEGRYLGGAAVYAAAYLGSGSQILGAVAVQDCTLGAGGSHEHSDPDSRGAVLKGVGRARHLSLATGQVIQGNGVFDAKDAKPQSFYHRPAKE
jgi:hypothetical protein